VQTARDIEKAGGEIPQETITIVNVYDSEFYGSYENTIAQAKGQIVRPTLD
jgi:hypothetical protein